MLFILFFKRTAGSLEIHLCFLFNNNQPSSLLPPTVHMLLHLADFLLTLTALTDIEGQIWTQNSNEPFEFTFETIVCGKKELKCQRLDLWVAFLKWSNNKTKYHCKRKLYKWQYKAPKSINSQDEIRWLSTYTIFQIISKIISSFLMIIWPFEHHFFSNCSFSQKCNVSF